MAKGETGPHGLYNALSVLLIGTNNLVHLSSQLRIMCYEANFDISFSAEERRIL
jgi:hypothetical protein